MKAQLVFGRVAVYEVNFFRKFPEVPNIIVFNGLSKAFSQKLETKENLHSS